MPKVNYCGDKIVLRITLKKIVQPTLTLPNKNLCCIFAVILLMLLQRPVLAANDSNQLEPNTIPELFEKSAMYGQQSMADRVGKILENESVEESLSKLAEYQLFMWPGLTWSLNQTYILKIPLSETIGRNDILQILGNRRFLKIIQDLSVLPKEKAANLVNNEINSSLQGYNLLFDSFLGRNAKLFEKDPKVRQQNHEGFSFAQFTADGKPTLLGVRCKVLSLVLIAGNLELKQCQPAVAKILETAIEQRNTFYNKDLWNVTDAFPILLRAGLYNRQILATGVLGTFIDKEKSGAILTNTGRKMASEKLTKFDSPVAAYDLTRWQQGKETDYTKGELNVKYLEPLSDSAFDNLINAVKTEQQKSIKPEDANSPAN
jgi:hypothetical protein